MKKDGVERAVVFSTATAPHQVEIINRFIRDTCRENPQLIGVGTMHPDYPDFEGEVKRMKESGLVGIKLHPDIQRFKLDDERLLPLYEIMSAENLFLIAHTGDYRYATTTPHPGAWPMWQGAFRSSAASPRTAAAGANGRMRGSA